MTTPTKWCVNNDLLRLINNEDQVVDFTPVHQMFQLVPVGQFIVTLDDDHNSYVAHKLQEVVRTESGMTVVGHQGEQQRAENTEGDDSGYVIVHKYRLGSVGESKLHWGVLRPKLHSLHTMMEGRGDGIFCIAVRLVRKLELSE